MAESGSSARGYGSLTVSNTALTLAGVPADGSDFTTASHVLVTVETASVRVRTDGAAPTSSEGHLLGVGDVFKYSGQLSKLQFIRATGSDGTIRCTFSYR